METNSEIAKLIEAVISIRMNAQKQGYGPTVDAVKRLNIEMSYGLLDVKVMRKPILSCLLGKRVVSTTLLNAGEVNGINNAIIKQSIPRHTLQCLELALGDWCLTPGQMPENFLRWNDDHSELNDTFVRMYWPMELPV